MWRSTASGIITNDDGHVYRHFSSFPGIVYVVVLVKLRPSHPNSMCVPLDSPFSVYILADLRPIPQSLSLSFRFSSSSCLFIDRRWFPTSGRSRSHTADVASWNTQPRKECGKCFSRSTVPLKSQTRQTVNTPPMDFADCFKKYFGKWTYLRF